MPIRNHIVWGPENPFSDPRLADLPQLLRNFRRGKLPTGWKGNKEFENRWLDLPVKPEGYYDEY